MRKDKIRLYFFEVILLVVLFVALFVSSKNTRIVLSIILLLFMVLIKLLFKKKRIIHHISKEVVLLMAGLALIYVGLFYGFGFVFYSFTKQTIRFGFSTLIGYIIPLTVIIITSEIIRFTLLSQDGKIRIKNSSHDYSKALTLINMVLTDLIIYVNVYDISRLNDFLALIGFVAFASISSNLFYNYYSNRFGIKGVIIYRLITVLYIYIIPIIPNMYIYFRSFLRMVWPYIMFIILENTYGRTTFVEPYNARKKNITIVTVVIVFMMLFTMLISCQFRYGIIVVGSGSMTGTINKGDATIFRKYDNQSIHEGDIIIFYYGNAKIIHRVIEIKNVNGETRYYTKGDANPTDDPDYRLKNDIIGISRLNIKYIGIPTLWLNELFSK